MAKFYFKTGAMGGGKSADLIRNAYNYNEWNLNAIVLKPSIDDRDGTEECVIKSRTGDSCAAEWLYEETNVFEMVQKRLETQAIHAIIIDEVQFITPAQVLQLSDIVTELDIPVMAYGLTSDFAGNLFRAIATLIPYVDKIEEIKSICWCGKKANHNARVIEGKVVKTGDVIQTGGNESYVPLCTKHYKRCEIGERRVK